MHDDDYEGDGTLAVCNSTADQPPRNMGALQYKYTSRNTYRLYTSSESLWRMTSNSPWTSSGTPSSNWIVWNTTDISSKHVFPPCIGAAADLPVAQYVFFVSSLMMRFMDSIFFVMNAHPTLRALLLLLMLCTTPETEGRKPPMSHRNKLMSGQTSISDSTDVKGLPFGVVVHGSSVHDIIFYFTNITTPIPLLCKAAMYVIRTTTT